MLLGAHVERHDPVGGARARGAEVIQLHLSPPRSWAPPIAHADDDRLAGWPGPKFVHAPYLCNPASRSPDVRFHTRRMLQVLTTAAARIGANGVIVHGGSSGNGDVDDAIAGWCRVLDGWSPACRILVENTADGRAAPARTVGGITRLFDALRHADHDVGFVLDTCHAFAAGMAPGHLVDRVTDAAGGIDLVHANDARVPFGSGREGHANLGHGLVDPVWLCEIVAGAAAPVVVETPGGIEAQRADLVWLRDHLHLPAPAGTPGGSVAPGEATAGP